MLVVVLQYIHLVHIMDLLLVSLFVEQSKVKYLNELKLGILIILLL